MACPLCDARQSGRSWLGSTHFGGREFSYVECSDCRSLYCDPMPDAQTLGLMYGDSYASAGGVPFSTDDPKEPERVLHWLGTRPSGVFVDYGCGAGALLAGAQQLGWQAVGVEFDPEVVRQVAARTGATVVSRLSDRFAGPDADVVSLGDVIEHLTSARHQVQELLTVLKPGGLLVAQGPLEANHNLFTLGLRTARTLRPRSGSFPPYHVMLATAEGQRRFFARLGLEEVVFQVSEVDWPAPSRLGRAALRSPRTLALFSLRRLSRLLSAVVPGGGWGNRYFYVGRLPAKADA